MKVPRLPSPALWLGRPLSLFNFTFGHTVQERVFMTCMPVVWLLKGLKKVNFQRTEPKTNMIMKRFLCFFSITLHRLYLPNSNYSGKFC